MSLCADFIQPGHTVDMLTTTRRAHCYRVLLFGDNRLYYEHIKFRNRTI